MRLLKLWQDHAYLMLKPKLPKLQLTSCSHANVGLRLYTFIVVKYNAYLYKYNLVSAPPRQQKSMLQEKV